MSETNSIFKRLSQALDKIVVGQSSTVQHLLVALLSGGHVIIEGVPGTGKTQLVKSDRPIDSSRFSPHSTNAGYFTVGYLGNEYF